MSNPEKAHWEAVKGILRYPKGTTENGLVFGGNQSERNLIGYCDSNYVGDRDKCKSTFDSVFTFYGATIS